MELFKESETFSYPISRFVSQTKQGKISMKYTIYPTDTIKELFHKMLSDLVETLPHFNQIPLPKNVKV